MSISVAKVNINTPSIAKSAAVCPEMKSAANLSHPSFGAIEIKDGKWLGKNVRWLGDDFTSTMQRGVSGVTALLTQPFFDWNNKKADKETRKTSTARTLGKIVAGTITGVLIREGCIQLTKNYCKTEGTEKERYIKAVAKARKKHKSTAGIPKPKTASQITAREKWLLPKGYEKNSFRDIKKYRNSMGTFLAVVVMIGTNFLIDAPLTTYLTNKFVKLFNSKESNKSTKNKVEGGKQ